MCHKNLKLTKRTYFGATKSSYEETFTKSSQQHKVYRIITETLGKPSQISFKHIGVSEERVPTNKCSASEPIFENPCLYEAVKTVMTEIVKKSGIPNYNNGKGEKQLIPIFCDGSPHKLCFWCMTSTYRCGLCETVECGWSTIEEHVQDAQATEDTSGISLELDWVLMQPGGGHIEMNMIKGIVDVCWDIFWKDLAVLMNFKSEKALQRCKKVTDHHKGWQLLQIARDSLARELVLPFVREELLIDTQIEPLLLSVNSCK